MRHSAAVVLALAASSLAAPATFDSRSSHHVKTEKHNAKRWSWPWSSSDESSASPQQWMTNGPPQSRPTGMPPGMPSGMPQGMPSGMPNGMPHMSGGPAGMPTFAAEPTGLYSGSGQPTGMPTMPSERSISRHKRWSWPWSSSDDSGAPPEESSPEQSPAEPGSMKLHKRWSWPWSSSDDSESSPEESLPEQSPAEPGSMKPNKRWSWPWSSSDESSGSQEQWMTDEPPTQARPTGAPGGVPTGMPNGAPPTSGGPSGMPAMPAQSSAPLQKRWWQFASGDGDLPSSWPPMQAPPSGSFPSGGFPSQAHVTSLPTGASRAGQPQEPVVNAILPVTSIQAVQASRPSQVASVQNLGPLPSSVIAAKESANPQYAYPTQAAAVAGGKASAKPILGAPVRQSAPLRVGTISEPTGLPRIPSEAQAHPSHAGVPSKPTGVPSFPPGAGVQDGWPSTYPEMPAPPPEFEGHDGPLAYPEMSSEPTIDIFPTEPLP